MTVKLVDFYKADGLGWYLGIFKATCDKNGDPILPTTGTTNKPALKDGYWYKLDFSSKKWSAVKKATTCAEAVEAGLSCVANSPNQHEQEVKALLENLVKAESDKYKTVIGDGMVMSIEEMPEKTVAEVKAEKLSELSSTAGQYDQYKCETMYVTVADGYKINADIRSQTNMQGLIDMMSDTDTTLYKDFDNAFHRVTKADLTTFKANCLENGQNLYQQKFKYEAQIAACTTVDEVNAITIEFTMMDFS